MNADGSGQTRLTHSLASDSDPSWSPDGRRIAFVSHRDGNYEIYVMNADGSGQTRLTHNSAGGSDPSWSPDGRRIAFEAADGIRVVNADGSGQTRLSDDPGNDYSPSWSPDGRRIAFASLREETWGIYVMNADGSSQTHLTNDSAWDPDPSWSPDGRRIAFHSNRDGNHEIYVMDADGSGQTRLTHNSATDGSPSWSFQSDPGTRPPALASLAFASFRDGTGEIYVMSADGSGQTRLTHSSASDLSPSWSPDGRRIAFHSDRDDPDRTDNIFIANIYVVNADGSGQTRLTHSSAGDSEPSWSPDGRRIAFMSFRDGGREIYVMNADGSGQTRLTHNSAGDWSPSWSPDGRRIAFMSLRDGNSAIYVMNADGSGQTRLTHNSAGDWSPSWSPDGRRIAFHSDRDDPDQTDNDRIANIYVMNADGSGQTRLTHSSASDSDPSWSPDGRRIAFRSLRDGNSEIYAMNVDGSSQTRLTNNSAWDGQPSWPIQGGPGPAPTPTPAPTAVPTPMPPTSYDVMRRIHCQSDDFVAAFGARFEETYNVPDDRTAVYSRNGRGLWETLTTRWVSSSDSRTAVVCRTKIYDNISSATLDNRYAAMVEEASGSWDVLRQHKLCCEEIGQGYRGLLLDIGKSASTGGTVQWLDTVSQRVAVSSFRWDQVIVQVAVYDDDAYYDGSGDAMARRVESRFDDSVFAQVETRQASRSEAKTGGAPPPEDSLYLAPPTAEH